MKEEYPTEREDGKVLNPSTDNWITQGFADGRGFLDEAKQYTQDYYRDQDDSVEQDVDEVPQTSGSLEDAGENFEKAGVEIGEDELDSMLDEAEHELETGREEFDDEDLPMTEEEFMQALDEDTTGPMQTNDGEYKGVYTKHSGPQPDPVDGEEPQNNKKYTTRDWNSNTDGKKFRYVRTKRGGMKKVRIDKDNG